MKKREPIQRTKQVPSPGPADLELALECLEALELAIPGQVRLLPEQTGPARTVQPDARLRVEVAGEVIEYVIEAKRTLREPDLGPIVHRAREGTGRGERHLLCATHVPDRLGEALRKQGVDYLDTDGNARLHGLSVSLLSQGRKPADRHHARAGLRGTEVRLLGVFLRDDDAGDQIQTELAQRAGIALGAVGRARMQLARIGVLEAVGQRRWRIRSRTLGLRLFGDGWATLVRGRLRPRTYHLLDADRRATLEMRLASAGAELGVLLGGERAAAHLTGFLHTEHATLHVPKDRRRLAARTLSLVPAEDGAVTLLDRYGSQDAFVLDKLPKVPLVHPLWAWAECLTIPDERAAQAAQLLHQQLMADA